MSLAITQIPVATLVIMLICLTISFVSSVINRLLISRFVGWEQYKEIQKELSEYRRETTQAMRKNDKKLLEKLKKKEPQIMNMQKQLLKPQLILLVLSLSYIFIWLFGLTPLYKSSTVAYIPIIGKAPLFYWYFICSFLFGTLAARLLGITPIE